MSSRKKPSMEQLFKQELQSCPMSGPNGYYFPWDIEQKRFEVGNFKPEYSNGRITRHDVDLLVDEINANPAVKLPTTCDIITVTFILVFLTMSVCSAVYGTMVKSYYGTFKYTWYIGGRVYIVDPNAYAIAQAIGIVLINAVGFPIVIALFWMKTKDKAQKFNTRKELISLISKKHLRTTFEGKNVTISQAPLTSYIFIGLAGHQMSTLAATRAQPINEDLFSN